jgi:hypothetical protein
MLSGRGKLSLMIFLRVLAMLLCGFVSVPMLSQFDEPFDKPVKKTVVNLGRSQYLMPESDQRVKLTCSYYPNFTVKEVNDPGWKGSKMLVVVPTSFAQSPECNRKRVPGDHLLRGGDSYFGGVKGDLVFLTDFDSTDGGMLFTVFDSKTGSKVFQDQAAFREHSGERSEIDFVRASGEQLTLRYMRVFAGDCSVAKDGIACWNKIRQRAGLVHAPMPACKDSEPPDGAPSAIGYPVEVTFIPMPSVKVLGNPSWCWPQL